MITLSRPAPQNLTLTVIRGLPGSGKSSVAAALSAATNAVLIEPDDFHIRDGAYDFLHANMPYSHLWAQGLAARHLFQGRSAIVADVFPALADLSPYRSMATHFGAALQVLDISGPWPDRHGVLPEDRARMIAAWEPWPTPAPSPLHHHEAKP